MYYIDDDDATDGGDWNSRQGFKIGDGVRLKSDGTYVPVEAKPYIGMSGTVESFDVSSSSWCYVRFPGVSALVNVPFTSLLKLSACECGSYRAGSPYHADYCPLFKPVEVL
jgi:hypothetical protein